MSRPLAAVVIGAGQSGLAASYELSRRGIEHLVLERGRIGETWLSQRWDSFALNTPNWMNGLPGAPYEGAEPEGFATAGALAGSFETHAGRFGLPVRTGVTVTGVDRGPGGFLVRTDNPELGDLAVARVVVASGIMHPRRLPPSAARLPGGVRQLHTSGYRRPGDLPAGAVLVVGGGQSGTQIAEDLAAAGRRVYLAASRVGRVPRRYRGRDFFDWAHDMAFFDTRAEELADPGERYAPLPLVSGVGRRGHSVSLQWLAERGVTLLGRLAAVDGGRLSFDDTLADSVRFGDQRSAEFKRAIDQFASARGVEALPPEDDPGDRPHPDPDRLRSPASVDLAEAGIGTVIWCTGFGRDFSWVRLPVLDERGLPRHEGGASPVPELFFLGIPWLRNRRSGLIAGAADDAASVVARMTGARAA